MNRRFALVSFLVLTTSLMISVPAFAEGQGDAIAKASAAPKRAADEARALPVVDTFEDQGQSLEIMVPGASYEKGSALTLVYQDEDANTWRFTVHPTHLVSAGRSSLDQFLAAMDPDFLSYVRATIGDRMIHLQQSATDFDRVEAAVFFPVKRVEATEGHSSDGVVETEFIPTTVD